MLIAIQQLNGIEKSSVAISLMLNHNLTGLYLFIMLLLLLAVIYLAWPDFVLLGGISRDSLFLVL